MNYEGQSGVGGRGYSGGSDGLGRCSGPKVIPQKHGAVTGLHEMHDLRLGGYLCARMLAG